LYGAKTSFAREEHVMALRRAFAAAISALFAAGTASAQTKVACGGSPPQTISVAPVAKFEVIDFTNRGADCALWQTFFYLNWPVLAGQRGVPDKNAKFGVARPTVWETYRRVEQVFLPNGQKPPPWSQQFLQAGLARDVATQIDTGQARLLLREAKISRRVINVIAQGFANDDFFLKFIRQADGNILYDQQKVPAYYEIAMNQVQFDYIVNSGLYNALTQVEFTTKTNIALPVGSIELKAAWKILTAAEATSGRFHTAKAYIWGPILQPVTVGLVGLHVFTGGGDKSVGLWGTFAQVDNVPLQQSIGQGPYSFFNPKCAGCKVNDPTTVPTQAVQMIPDDPTAAALNTQVQAMIKDYDSKTAWQYYKLINVQWSTQTINLNTPVPINLPLPQGKPTTDTLMNPVLETFMQQQGVSCLGCHSTYASIAKNTAIGSGFSFMFSNAGPNNP
jgi:hypothetical protein